MRLFDAFKRKPLHPSGIAGTAASVAPSAQHQSTTYLPAGTSVIHPERGRGKVVGFQF
tara:strand:+ start:422 stop:595 length:174 start_codon:yes stop_codon:yes gene_type:complete